MTLMPVPSPLTCSHAITKTLRVPAEAVDSMDAILKSLVEAAGEGASARMRAVADAAFVDSPALCASALAQGIHGTAATALLALSEEAWGPDARATSALALQVGEEGRQSTSASACPRVPVCACQNR